MRPPMSRAVFSDAKEYVRYNLSSDIGLFKRLTSGHCKSPDSSGTKMIHFVSIVHIKAWRKQQGLTMQERRQRDPASEESDNWLDPSLPKLQFQGLYSG